jgi:hypothetical protein
MELMDYWAEHPPTHDLIGAYMGVGSEKAKQFEDCTEDELDELLGRTNG